MIVVAVFFVDGLYTKFWRHVPNVIVTSIVECDVVGFESGRDAFPEIICRPFG